jgi:hypothetical protein
MIIALLLYIVVNLVIVLYLRYQAGNSGYAEMLHNGKRNKT